MTRKLPPSPDFGAIDAIAATTADRRTTILALIGNLVFTWSNNESMFIYVIMLLLETDEKSAMIVFSTLNTTRARLDLVQRLAKAKLTDRTVRRSLDRLITRFTEQTRERNELNHCLYAVSDRGEITHTRSLRLNDSGGRLSIGSVRQMDDGRIAEMAELIAASKALNRDLWSFLPVLEAEIAAVRRQSSPSSSTPVTPPEPSPCP